MSVSAPLALVAAAIACLGCAPESLAPNVVLVSLDTVRADRLPLHGYRRDTAPALTAFAQSGVVFDNAYSQAPNTIPTHASILTGRFPFQHQTYVYGETLAEEEFTLAEYLSRNGYRTFALTTSIRFERSSGFAQGFDHYETFDHLEKNDRSARVNARALELASAQGDRPYFAFLHYFDAHVPYAAPSPFRTLWHPGLASLAPEDTAELMVKHRYPDQTLEPALVEYLSDLYDGSLRYLDRGLAQLFDFLGDAPNGRPTLWIITSDHGEEFKEHGVLLHSNYLHEELLRVPLIVSLPGTLRGGQRIQTPVQSVDLFPTLVELLGLPMPANLAGRSHAAALRGGGPATAATRVRDLVAVEANPSWGVIGTLDTGRFKWVTGRETGLFRLDVDPRADHEVSERYPDERDALIQAADEIGLRQALLEREQRWIEEQPKLKRLPQVIERLRALGYVEEVE